MRRYSPDQLLVWFLSSVLLVGVAGWHSYQVETKGLTPWEGGGFGMFSTVDKREARFVRCYLITPEQEVLVRTPPHLDTYVDRLRAMPTQKRAGHLAQFMAQSTWVASEDVPENVSADHTVPPGRYRYLSPSDTSSRARATVEAVRVEVWQYQFVSQPYRLEAHPLFAVTREAPPSEGPNA